MLCSGSHGQGAPKRAARRTPGNDIAPIQSRPPSFGSGRMQPLTSKYSLLCSTSSPAQRRRTIVIDSSKSFVWSLLVRPKSSNSGSKFAMPTPRIIRPSEITSTMAACSATCTGL
jgi:hypothetical protein